MLIRIRSRDGNFRFELEPTAPISELVAKILETSPDADPPTITISNSPRGGEYPVTKLDGNTLQSLGLKHGHLVFVGYQPKSASSGQAIIEQPLPNGHVTEIQEPVVRPWEIVEEDPVDTYWRAKDGKIHRSRDARFCTHGANGMCDYCMPLEPYDAAYHKEHNVKHLSYHAYLQKITPKSTPANATTLPPLNPLSYKVKIPCPTGSHAPWPAGICTTCQPSAITLQSQPFRMVDHLEIASVSIIDKFLQAWRRTGLQRLGFLIGRYEPYEEVPMGIKAVVEAIYEPPQQGEPDGLTVGIPWEDESRIREIAKSAAAPLSVVGCIFTDLDPTPEDRTKNIYKRHAGSFFLSSLETIFAANLQMANPITSRSSPTGHFASRMITAVLTATVEGQVDIAAYQVSEQACAMVEADMIQASVVPGTVLVKEEDRSEDSACYVPDVFFSYKNEYGLEVKKSAKPSFPVEYLLVNVTHGFPQNPSPVFRSMEFTIENRPGLEDQRIEDVLSALLRFGAPDILPSSDTVEDDTRTRLDIAKWLSDWHLIAFLGTTQIFSDQDLKTAVRTATSPQLLEDIRRLDDVIRTESWQTLVTLARESAPAHPSTSAPTNARSTNDDIPPEIFDQIAAEEAAIRNSRAGPSRNIRICPHCTVENDHGGSDCEVCGLPLD